jgi:peroxiredoxin
MIKILRLSAFMLLFFAFAAEGFSQTISLDFPKAAGKEAWLYTFTGSRVDSLSVMLDANGKSHIPHLTTHEPRTTTHDPRTTSPYRGIAYLHIPGVGTSEFILAEEHLDIFCSEEKFKAGTLQFKQSPENDFMLATFNRRTLLSQQQEWLQAGEYFIANGANANFVSLYEKMLVENKNDMQQLEQEITASPLYAARFLELISFMQRLYAATQSLDAAHQQAVRNEMENSLDLDALYHAGNLWVDTHTYYSGAFADSGDHIDQLLYALSIGATMRRLQEPVFTAFFSSALSACERYGYQQAQEVMLNNFIVTYPEYNVTDAKIKTLLDGLKATKGNPAPAITGLTTPLTGRAIVIFFESECDHCMDEIEWLSAHYKEINARGYRIISIAADREINNYKNVSNAFPWNEADRLCDLKGFAGENFKNYGVIGTPSIFVIDEKGKIELKFAKMKDAKLLDTRP